MLARLVRTVLVGGLVVLGLAAPLAVPATAGDDDVTWTVRTGSNDLGADRTSFVYTVDPGGAVDDTLVVANHGTTPLDLGVYAADGYTTDGGQLDLLTTDQTSTGVGAWVEAGAHDVTVQPGASLDVPFTVQVPATATPGDYVGGIVTTLTQSDTDQGINVDRRLGVRITLHVSGQVQPSLAVEHVAVAYHGTLDPFGTGDATITYTLHNTGNAVVSAQQAATVVGPFGRLKAEAGDVAAPPQLLPGESWKVTVPVEHVAPTVRISATAVVTPLVTDASGSTSPLDAQSATASAWAVPWSLLVLVLLVAVAVVGAIGVVRRNRRRRAAQQAARVQEAVDLALRERAASTS